MAYNTKAIKTDVDKKPIPQYYNPTLDQYEALLGENGATRHILYGPDGNPLSTDDSNKLAVRASEIETILNEIKSKDFATQTTLAAILAKIIAAPATEAKQDTLIGHVGGVESALASILAKLIAAPATEAKQDALAALIGEVDANPTENTLLARIKALETKIDAIIDGTSSANVQLSGSNVEIGGVTYAVSGGDTIRNTAANKPDAAAAHAVIPYCYYFSIDTGVVEATDGTNWVVI